MEQQGPLMRPSTSLAYALQKVLGLSQFLQYDPALEEDTSEDNP